MAESRNESCLARLTSELIRKDHRHSSLLVNGESGIRFGDIVISSAFLKWHHQTKACANPG